MNSIKLISIGLLFLGLIILAFGILLLVFSIIPWTAILILIGLLLLIASIIVLCVSLQYDNPINMDNLNNIDTSTVIIDDPLNKL